MKKLLIASALLLGLSGPGLSGLFSLAQVKAQNIFPTPSESLRQFERQRQQRRIDEQRRRQQRWQDEQRWKQQDLERRIDDLERKERQIESDPALKWLRQMQRR